MGNILKKVLFICFFLLCFGLVSKSLFLQTYPDFSVYYYSAQNVLHGMNPYISNPQTSDLFLYPPFALYVFAPLSMLDLKQAGILFTIISIVCLFTSLKKLYGYYNVTFFSNMALLLSSLVFLSFPVRFTLGMGQINFLILFLLVYFFTSYVQKKRLQASLYLGFAYALKLFPLLFIPYFIIKKEWKELLSVLLVFLLSIILSLGIISPAILYQYFTHLPSFAQSWPDSYYNQALSGFISHVGIMQGREVLRILLTVLFLMITGICIYIDRKSSRKIDLHIGSIITLSLLINSFSWQHHFVFLIIPFISAFFYLQKQKSSIIFYLLLFISYILIATNLKHPETFPGIIQSHAFLGTILLWILLLVMIVKTNE